MVKTPEAKLWSQSCKCLRDLQSTDVMNECKSLGTQKGSTRPFGRISVLEWVGSVQLVLVKSVTLRNKNLLTTTEKHYFEALGFYAFRQTVDAPLSLSSPEIKTWFREETKNLPRLFDLESWLPGKLIFRTEFISFLCKKKKTAQNYNTHPKCENCHFICGGKFLSFCSNSWGNCERHCFQSRRLCHLNGKNCGFNFESLCFWE